ncbi:Transposon Ty2-GR1 Gag-Pol polyprotein [Frankliniella fusca]|uniref:Transposon Ty2-GR1 Gag-Pol polyprotein n=1 Tax=Frankliniella fusca TaxID=407009 RepID=A0AAE1HML4_9NEOP|nr:Transposon Ty2-GR1 Gag-Pol polyprotein [Frankliniella fusca]
MSDIEEGEIPESLLQRVTDVRSLPELFSRQTGSMTAEESEKLFDDLNNKFHGNRDVVLRVSQGQGSFKTNDTYFDGEFGGVIVRSEKPKIKQVNTKDIVKVRAHCSKDEAPVRQNNCPKKVPTGTAKKTVKPTTVVKNFKGKVQRDNFEMDGMATFIESFINEPCKTADNTEKPQVLPKCYVRLERLPASQIPKTAGATKRGKPSVLKVKKTIKKNKAAKKVAAVKKLGFDVNNRAGLIRDPKILCPVDGNMSNNFSHIL